MNTQLLYNIQQSDTIRKQAERIAQLESEREQLLKIHDKVCGQTVELLTALQDITGAFAKARTMRAPAGHYDEDIYYNGIDLHAQIENAREAIAKATA